MRLNIGCGEKKMAGYVNVDLYGTPDVKCDLSNFPWPFDTNSADEVYSAHFLEHVHDYEKTVLEIHRILKPGGTFHFKVPHFRTPAAYWHLHTYYFSTHTCAMLCKSLPYQWQGRQLFTFGKVKINYIFLRPFFAKILGTLANIDPNRWDWLGLPIEEVECVVYKASCESSERTYEL